jgi:hypothetical protein
VTLMTILGCATAGLLLGGWLLRHHRRRPAVVVAVPVAAEIPEAAAAPKAVGAAVNRAGRGLGNMGANRFGPAHDNVRAIDLSSTRGPGRPGWTAGRRR